MRGVQGFVWGDGKGRDWLAVEAVSSEPVSANFPVKQGKNREFFQCWGILSILIRSNTLELQQFLSNFPTHQNREFKLLNRETQSSFREPQHRGFVGSNPEPATTDN